MTTARVEDPPLLTGRGRFMDEIDPLAAEQGCEARNGLRVEWPLLAPPLI